MPAAKPPTPEIAPAPAATRWQACWRQLVVTEQVAALCTALPPRSATARRAAVDRVLARAEDLPAADQAWLRHRGIEASAAAQRACQARLTRWTTRWARARAEVAAHGTSADMTAAWHATSPHRPPHDATAGGVDTAWRRGLIPRWRAALVEDVVLGRWAVRDAVRLVATTQGCVHDDWLDDFVRALHTALTDAARRVGGPRALEAGLTALWTVDATEKEWPRALWSAWQREAVGTLQARARATPWIQDLRDRLGPPRDATTPLTHADLDGYRWMDGRGAPPSRTERETLIARLPAPTAALRANPEERRIWKRLSDGLAGTGRTWSAVRPLWERAGTPAMHALLLCETTLSRGGPWWSEPTFRQEAIHALETGAGGTTATDVWWVRVNLMEGVLRHGLGTIPWIDWMRLACWLWVPADGGRALGVLEQASARPAWAPAAADLVPALHHASGPIRVWAQLQLARVAAGPAPMERPHVAPRDGVARPEGVAGGLVTPAATPLR